VRTILALTLAALPLVTLASEPQTSGAACPVTQPVRATPASDPNADPFGEGPWYINADRTIWATSNVGGMVASPNRNKVLWIRPWGGDLTVTGRRLDGEPDPMTATIPCCYPTGFQASGLIFPTPGCWEVTANSGSRSLTFVASVGPAGVARR
jgi:hypothetical protein